jgi:hypothetical protein
VADTRLLNTNKQARKVAAQQAGQTVLEGSFESDPVSLGIAEKLNVEGLSYVFAYGGGAVTCHDAPGGTPVALEDRTGTAVVVTTARLIEVRGVRHIAFAAASVVIACG